MRRRPPWSLQKRLVLGVTALLALASLAIGGVSVVALERFLLSRLDTQLVVTAEQTLEVGGTPDPDRLLRSLGAGALAVVLVEGSIGPVRIVSDRGEQIVVDRAATERELANLPADGRPVTRDLDGTLGDYRLVASSPAPGVEVIIGLPLEGTRETTARLFGIVALVGGMVLVLTGLVGAAVIRFGLRPLDRVAAIAGRVAGQQLDRGEVALAERVPVDDTDERTEVGKVGAAFNRMLEHVSAALNSRERSERKVRQFVADASHELRTPLTAIRGYAELTRRAPYDLPDDVRHSLARIESESVRMTALVEELLLLARLDEGRELQLAPVDLADLAGEAIGDALAASTDHEFELDAPDAAVVVPADRARLHQVLTNLLANARVHTPAGTRVRVEVRRDGAAAELAVVDDGPGIDPEILPTLFERFVRGDASRSRRAGGTGLGLAIVRAIVDAHGGAVDVESRPGRTAFTVRLPAQAPPPTG